MKIILLSIMLLLTSCLGFKKNKTNLAQFDLKLTEEWIYTENLSGPKYNNVVITSLPGFEQLVMQLTIPQKGGLGKYLHCVYYTVPYKEKISLFKVQQIKNDESCPESSDKGKTFISLNGINNLKITFAKFKLTMDFQFEKTQKKIEIPLPNFEAGLVHEKFHSIEEKRLMSGLKFLRLNDASFEYSNNRYLGKLSDRFSRGTAIRCHQVDRECNTVGENRCEECRYGWYEVVDFQCPQGGSKFCGQNHCGEKNEPACPRGIRVVAPEEAGICQSDLEPVINGDKILVCQ